MVVFSLKKTLRIISITCALVGVYPIAASAQSFDSAAAAAAEVRFQQLEKEIRRLTGQIEKHGYEIRRLRDELARVTGDLEVRVSELDGKKSGPQYSHQSGVNTMPVPHDIASKLPSQKVILEDKTSSSFHYRPPQNGTQTLGVLKKSPQNGAVTSADSPAASYDHAYSFIKLRDFTRAEAEFAKFMNDYPKHPLMSNAKYWYGETFYVRGDYERAARFFAEGYQQYPRGSKAASNLLKLGMSLTGMGKKDDACIAYKQLKKDYAKSSVPVLKRAETEMKRINCR